MPPMNIEEVFSKCKDGQKLVLVHDEDAQIFYIVMNTPYNMIDIEFLTEYNRILDKIQQREEQEGTIVTISSGQKVFCSGFNIQMWMKDPSTVPVSLTMFHDLMKRILTFEMPMICAVRGQCIAGGVFLAMAHDYIIMNANPKFCMFLNEILNGFVVPPGLVRMVQEYTTPLAYKRLIMGERIKSTVLADLGIINTLYKDHDDLAEQIKDYAQQNGRKAGEVLAKSKVNIHSRVLPHLKFVFDGQGQKQKKGFKVAKL